MKGLDFVRWYVPLLLWGITILILTSIPKLTPPDLGFDAQDKLAHFGVYYILGLLLVRALGKGLVLPHRILLLSFFYALLFAAFDELHQLFIPGRAGDIFDFLADSFGILFALLSFFMFKNLKPKNAR